MPISSSSSTASTEKGREEEQPAALGVILQPDVLFPGELHPLRELPARLGKVGRGRRRGMHLRLRDVGLELDGVRTGLGRRIDQPLRLVDAAVVVVADLGDDQSRRAGAHGSRADEHSGHSSHVLQRGVAFARETGALPAAARRAARVRLVRCRGGTCSARLSDQPRQATRDPAAQPRAPRLRALRTRLFVPAAERRRARCLLRLKGDGWDDRITVEPRRMAAKLEQKLRRATRWTSHCSPRSPSFRRRKTPRTRLRLRDRGLAGRAGRRRLGNRRDRARKARGCRGSNPAHAARRDPGEPSFELVVVQHTLEHLRNPRETLSRLAAATVPGGLIYVSVPNLPTLCPSTATSTTSRATNTSPRSPSLARLALRPRRIRVDRPLERPVLAGAGRASGRAEAARGYRPASGCRGAAAGRAAELCARGPRGHAARQPEPERRLPVTTWRRVLRRIRRFFP